MFSTRICSRRFAAGLVAGSLLVSACGSDDSADGPDDSADRSDARPTTALERSGPNLASTDWGTEFTGSPGGTATGEPVRIGFAHSGDFFPDGDVAADATVRFVNEHLGGVDGRPIELVRCSVTAPADGARCGAEFANDEDIALVLGGLVLHGSSDLYRALAGRLAAIISLPLDASDYVSDDAVSFNMGALGAGLGGAVFLAEDLQPDTAALVVTDDVAGRAANNAFRPLVEAAGIELRQVFVSPTATAAEISGALEATRAHEADVLVVGLFEAGCIATFDALRSLAIEPVVTTNAPCWGPGMRSHVSSIIDDDVPNGWYFGWFGYRPFGENLEPGIAALNDVMNVYGEPSVLHGLAAAPIWEALLIAVRVLNDVGPDAGTTVIDEAVRSYPGPAIIQSGPIACGNPPFQSICASEVSIIQYLDGEWVGTRSGEDGSAIDLAPVFAHG
jgi:branched-chain amino acid transport system substrate-binding protein